MSTSEIANNPVASSPNRDAKKRPRVFGGLQALRGIAALSVLLTHAGYYATERLVPGHGFWHRGAAGVGLFFALSGFVMVHSSKSLFQDPSGWKIFAERRIVRIVPLYWLVTSLKLATMLASKGLVRHSKFAWTPVIASYLFLPSWNADHELRPLLGVGWTLNFEMFFYVLFCIALALRWNVLVMLSTVFAALYLGSYLPLHSTSPFKFYLDPIVLNFLWGMLIAYVVPRFRSLDKRISVGLLLLGTALVFVLPVPDALIGIGSGLVVWSLVQLESHLTWIPTWMLFLGDASYSIYLIHPTVAPLAPTVLARLHHPSFALSLFFSVLLALVVGCLLHTWVELPMTSFFREHIRLRGRKFIHLPESVPSR